VGEVVGADAHERQLRLVGRLPYVPGCPLLSWEMTVSSQASHSVAARDRTSMSGSSIICEYAWSRPEIGGVSSVGSR